jgi:hypothetical protein
MPPPDTYRRDRAHGFPVPEGRTLANLVGAWLPRIGLDVQRQVEAGQPIDLGHWIDTLTTAAAPIVEQYWREGYRQRARAILAEVTHRQKNLGPPRWAGRLPDIASRVKAAVQTFVTSVVGTLVRKTKEAVSRGADFLHLFTDKSKAAEVGATESHRAGMDGALVAAEHSGIVREHVWLISYAACKLCTSLAGLVVPIGEPFVVLPGGGPYNVIYAPPAHGHCRCWLKELVDASLTPDLGRLRRMGMR